MRSVVLTVGGITEEAVLQLLDGEGLLELEGRAVSSLVAPVPGDDAEADACDAAKREVGVFDEVHLDIEEDFFKTRNRELGLDDGGIGGDFGEGLEDGDAGRDDVVSADGLVPISSVLYSNQ